MTYTLPEYPSHNPPPRPTPDRLTDAATGALACLDDAGVLAAVSRSHPALMDKLAAALSHAAFESESFVAFVTEGGAEAWWNEFHAMIPGLVGDLLATAREGDSK